MTITASQESELLSLEQALLARENDVPIKERMAFRSQIGSTVRNAIHLIGHLRAQKASIERIEKAALGQLAAIQLAGEAFLPKQVLLAARRESVRGELMDSLSHVRQAREEVKTGMPMLSALHKFDSDETRGKGKGVLAGLVPDAVRRAAPARPKAVADNRPPEETAPFLGDVTAVIDSISRYNREAKEARTVETYLDKHARANVKIGMATAKVLAYPIHAAGKAVSFVVQAACTGGPISEAVCTVAEKGLHAVEGLAPDFVRDIKHSAPEATTLMAQRYDIGEKDVRQFYKDVGAIALMGATGAASKALKSVRAIEPASEWKIVGVIKPLPGPGVVKTPMAIAASDVHRTALTIAAPFMPPPLAVGGTGRLPAVWLSERLGGDSHALFSSIPEPIGMAPKVLYVEALHDRTNSFRHSVVPEVEKLAEGGQLVQATISSAQELRTLIQRTEGITDLFIRAHGDPTTIYLNPYGTKASAFAQGWPLHNFVPGARVTLEACSTALKPSDGSLSFAEELQTMVGSRATVVAAAAPIVGSFTKVKSGHVLLHGVTGVDETVRMNRISNQELYRTLRRGELVPSLEGFTKLRGNVVEFNGVLPDDLIMVQYHRGTLRPTWFVSAKEANGLSTLEELTKHFGMIPGAELTHVSVTRVPKGDFAKLMRGMTSTTDRWTGKMYAGVGEQYFFGDFDEAWPTVTRPLSAPPLSNFRDFDALATARTSRQVSFGKATDPLLPWHAVERPRPLSDLPTLSGLRDLGNLPAGMPRSSTEFYKRCDVLYAKVSEQDGPGYLRFNLPFLANDKHFFALIHHGVELPVELLRDKITPINGYRHMVNSKCMTSRQRVFHIAKTITELADSRQVIIAWNPTKIPDMITDLNKWQYDVQAVGDLPTAWGGKGLTIAAIQKKTEPT